MSLCFYFRCGRGNRIHTTRADQTAQRDILFLEVTVLMAFQVEEKRQKHLPQYFMFPASWSRNSFFFLVFFILFADSLILILLGANLTAK